ncbi:hypothetical protein SDC9_08717 [bioreactor metagenome]|uniref:Mannosylglycerate hydrolase MGH1-like glycoside hydrolase domain-containing protein n=1 Tax=bioreactor metagenome TaxID=1076179 RepID=A0A644T9E9_9ZZZZ|nr:trehalase family glycosidase [Lentimicrobium sp.]MEA5109316.1 trehalase family glycosidase [Lentimicrobium sp.]
MTSRRNFLRNAALLAASAGAPSIAMKAAGLSAGSSSDAQAPADSNARFKNTYVKNVFVTENEFRNARPSITPSPGFDMAREILPVPFWEGNPAAAEMYWKAWEIAFRNIKDPAPASGFISSYLDTAYNGNIFMWDSAFITMFARYGSRAYPFQKTLDNFYAKQHPDGFICREIWGDSGEDCFHRYDPTSTGPNIIPWSEIEYYHHFGDLDRIHKIFPVLVAYYQWLRLNRTWQDGSYWSSGWGTGMDNQPRVHKNYNPIFSHGHMTWLDTCLQQLFIGKILVDFGFYTERWQEIEDIEDETKFLKKFIKERLWDSKTSFFYDKYADGSRGNFMGIGAFWALWTDILEKQELDSFVKHLVNKDTFSRPHPVASMPANHEKYQSDGRYWQGGVWAPTNYMIISGLRSKGYHDVAFDIAGRHYKQVAEVFRKTGTFWEYYSPETPDQGFLARPDFVGWTGLVPVSVLFEGIFGIKAAVTSKTLNWDVHLTDAHGIDKYPFGKDSLLNLKCSARNTAGQKPLIEIQSDTELTLNYSWKGGKDSMKIVPGTNKNF